MRASPLDDKKDIDGGKRNNLDKEKVVETNNERSIFNVKR